MLEQFCHFAEALGMARRQNHYSSRMAGQNIHESLQQNWFFAIDRASANNHGAGASLLERPAQASYDRRRSRGRHVKLKVPGYVDALSGRANFLKSCEHLR